MKKFEFTAKTVNEAIEKAMAELKTTKDKLEIEILDEGSKGFFNMFGSKPAKIIASLIDETIENQESPKFEEKTEVVQKQQYINTSENTKENNKDYIQEAEIFLRDILDNMGIMAEIKIKEEKDIINISLSGPKMGLIIGYRGETLDALQYLVSLVVNKGHNMSYKKVVLDTENYREKREQTLRRLAVKTASKVRKMGRPYKLEPMNPYERRIIHSALQHESGIITYSEGEEPYRRIVVDIKR